MAATFPPIRLHTLPLAMKAHTFTRALLNLWDYYIGSRARKCVVIDLRISHLHRLEFTTSSGTAASGLRYLEMPDSASLYLLARIWKLLRSPEYGLSDALVAAIQHVSIDKRQRGEREEQCHSQDVDDFVTSFRELDAIFMGDEQSLRAAEEECVALMKADIDEHPTDTPYSLDSINKRVSYADSAVVVEKYLKACPADVTRLCAAPYYTRCWSARQVEQRRDWSTSDEALTAFLNQSDRKATGRASTEKESCDSAPLGPNVKPPKAKRRKQIMTAQGSSPHVQ